MFDISISFDVPLAAKRHELLWYSWTKMRNYGDNVLPMASLLENPLVEARTGSDEYKTRHIKLKQRPCKLAAR